MGHVSLMEVMIVMVVDNCEWNGVREVIRGEKGSIRNGFEGYWMYFWL